MDPREVGALLLDVGLPPQLKGNINAETWIDDVNLEKATPNDLITYVVSRMTIYHHIDSLVDEDMWDQIREDFEGWTTDHFKTAKVVLSHLKNFVMQRGVYVPTKGTQNAPAIMSILNAKEYAEWTEERIEEYRNKAIDWSPRSRFVVHLQGFKATPTLLPPLVHMLPPLPTTTPQPQATATAGQGNTQHPTPPTTPLPRQPDQEIPGEGSCYASTTMPPIQRAFSEIPTIPINTPTTNDQERDRRYRLPPDPTHNEHPPYEILNTFHSSYKDEDMFSGDLYDAFNAKVRIFIKSCIGAGLQPSNYFAGFPYILKGRARAFYNNHMHPDDSFAVMYNALQQRFDMDIDKQIYYTEWTEITFDQVGYENPTKNSQEVLEALIEKMQLLQQLLGPKYLDDEILRTNIIRACRDTEELKLAMYRPADSVEQLYHDLRSAIETENRHKSTIIADIDPDQGDPDQFYQDKRYKKWGQGPGGDNLGPFQRNTYRGSSNRSFIPYRSSSNRFRRPGDGKKKCVVCGKEGCWSIKHSIGERNRLRKQYLQECKDEGHQPSETDYGTYLLEQEGTEEDPNGFQLVEAGEEGRRSHYVTEDPGGVNDNIVEEED